MIRTGRPVFRIKAHWISFDGPDGIEYFQLDSRGNLIKKDGKFLCELKKKDETSVKKPKVELKNESIDKSMNDEDSFVFDSIFDFTSDPFDITFDNDDVLNYHLDEFCFDSYF